MKCGSPSVERRGFLGSIIRPFGLCDFRTQRSNTASSNVRLASRKSESTQRPRLWRTVSSTATRLASTSPLRRCGIAGSDARRQWISSGKLLRCAGCQMSCVRTWSHCRDARKAWQPGGVCASTTHERRQRTWRRVSVCFDALRHGAAAVPIILHAVCIDVLVPRLLPRNTLPPRLLPRELVTGGRSLQGSAFQGWSPGTRIDSLIPSRVAYNAVGTCRCLCPEGCGSVSTLDKPAASTDARFGFPRQRRTDDRSF